MFDRRSCSILHLLLLALGLVVLASCGSNQPSQPAVNEPGVLVCSRECGDRSQCGVLQSAEHAVLANEGGPAVTLHDRYFLDGTTVTVLEINERQLLPAQNGVPIPNSTPFPHNFFRVSEAGGKTAWVSGWCIERP
jgi:hypothetical protein